jgi:hypothetical protein
MVISGDKDFEQLLELYEKGKTEELRALLDAHMTTKTRFRGNSVNFDNIVTRDMSSISIDSNFSDGNLNFNDYLNLGLDGTQTRSNRSFSNSSWLAFNTSTGGGSSIGGSGKQRSGRSERSSRAATADSIGSIFDLRSRTGTTDSIGSMVDINRSLSDDMFDNIVAQIADDGGFNYDEFSQGKPVVRMNTSKGILSQVQDDYYDSSTPTAGNLNKRDRHVVENEGNAIAQYRSNSIGTLGTDLFNFDNTYINCNNDMEDVHSDTNINPIPVYMNNINNGDSMRKKHRNSKNADTHRVNNCITKYITSRRRTRSSSEDYGIRTVGRLSGVNSGNEDARSKQMIGKLTKEERRRRIDRWLEKRKHRNWSRQVI